MKNIKNIGKTLGLSAAVAAMALFAPQGATAQSQDFVLKRERPRLVVLLHGVTRKPQEAWEEKIVMSGHARHYWGFNFIKGLQGRTDETQMHVVTPTLSGNLRLRTTGKDGWVPSTTDTTSGDMAPICLPIRTWGELPPTIQNNTGAIKDFLRLTTRNQGADATMVMINTRDGSRHFMPQLGETIDEVYRSYITAFGHIAEEDQPQIYLVGHSFGGIIARGILANPDKPDLFGNKLTATQRTRCEYLRKRVVLIKTLSAPHHGTLIGDPASDVAAYVKQFGYAQVVSALDVYNEWIADEELTPKEIKEKAKEIVQGALDAISGDRDCLDDLARVNEYNAGILRPETAVRMPGGTLVPIYTASGRNPGGNFMDRSRKVFALGGFDEFNPIDMIDLFRKGSSDARDAASLNLIEGIMHAEGYGLEGKRPWGSATLADGDRVASPWAGYGMNVARPVSALWQPHQKRLIDVALKFMEGAPYRFGSSDREWDSDGFLAWNSGNALNINAINYFRPFDRVRYGDQLPWDMDNHGSIKTNVGNGLWIHNELIRDAGPNILRAALRRSTWEYNDVPMTPKANVNIDFSWIADRWDVLDPASDADMRVKVTVGGRSIERVLPGNTEVVSNILPMNFDNVTGTVIPIMIEVNEDDVPDPDDICVVSPSIGKSTMFLYLDTRTGRIEGDLSSTAGASITTAPMWVVPQFWPVDNQVSTSFRVTYNSWMQ